MPLKNYALWGILTLTLVGNGIVGGARGKVPQSPKNFQLKSPKAQPYERPDLKVARLQSEMKWLQKERNSLLQEYTPNSPKVTANERLLEQRKQELARVLRGNVVLLRLIDPQPANALKIRNALSEKQ